MKEDEKIIRIDDILWYVYTGKMGRHPQPLCPKHRLRLKPIKGYYDDVDDSRDLQCEDCKKLYKISRSLRNERRYVVDKIDAKVFRNMKVLNLDDEAIPLSEEKLSSEDKKYFVTSLLTKSKVGLRLVVYAGEKGKKEKTQIFIEPGIKRLAFDQKDLHPTEIFTKVEAIFKDGEKSSLSK